MNFWNWFKQVRPVVEDKLSEEDFALVDPDATIDEEIKKMDLVVAECDVAARKGVLTDVVVENHEVGKTTYTFRYKSFVCRFIVCATKVAGLSAIGITAASLFLVLQATAICCNVAEAQRPLAKGQGLSAELVAIGRSEIDRCDSAKISEGILTITLESVKNVVG